MPPKFRSTTIYLAALMLLVLATGCENHVCGEYRAFFEDPRLELVAGRVAAGREGAIFQISSKKLGLAPQIVVADSTTSEDILAIAPRGSASDVVLVVGRAGALLISHDGGVTWSRPELPENFRTDLHAVEFACGDLADDWPGLAVGANGSALRSVDSGNSWTEVSTGRSGTLRSIAVIGPNEVVVVGDQGLVLKSADLGESWSDVPSTSSDDLVRVIAMSPTCHGPAEDPAAADYLLAAGRQGDLLVSRDRGHTWEVFAKFPAGPVVDFFPFVDFDPSVPGTEILGATVVSGRVLWDFDASGTLIRYKEFPAEITSAVPSAEFIVAGGALYHPHYDPGCD